MDKFWRSCYLYYNTATQSNIEMPSVKENGSWVYYLSKDENPKSFTIIANSAYGIKQVSCSWPEKTFVPFPDAVAISATAIPKLSNTNTPGVIDVYMDEIDNVRSATVTFNIDNPEGLNIQYRSPYMLRTYTEKDVKNGKLTVKVDPNNEVKWLISRQGSTPICKVVVDGKKLKREKTFVYTAVNASSYKSAFVMNITEPKEYTVDITRDFPQFDIPVSLVVENDGGNETNPTVLKGLISSVAIDGVKLDRSVWMADNFTVKNGQELTFTFPANQKGTWELKERKINDETFTSNTVRIEGDDETPQTVSVKALANTPWRFIIKSTPDTYDKFNAYLWYTN